MNINIIGTSEIKRKDEGDFGATITELFTQETKTAIQELDNINQGMGIKGKELPAFQ